MSYSHPDIVFSKSKMKRINIQSISTRSACPYCGSGGLTNELIRNGDHYVTSCSICSKSVNMSNEWKAYKPDDF